MRGDLKPLRTAVRPLASIASASGRSITTPQSQPGIRVAQPAVLHRQSRPCRPTSPPQSGQRPATAGTSSAAAAAAAGAPGACRTSPTTEAASSRTSAMNRSG